MGNPRLVSRQGTFRLLFIATLVVVTWQALTPLPVTVLSAIDDKLGHLLAFLMLALLANQGWPGRNYLFRQALPLLGYGAMIELVQYFVPGRSLSVGDWIADGTGLLIYFLLMRLALIPNPLIKTTIIRNIR